MKVILCIDNKNGTMFNGRRQSRDFILCRKTADIVGKSKLYLKGYSYSLFEKLNLNIIQDENFLNVAQKGDFCFVEGDSLVQHINSVEEIILFKWNRDYPSDVKMDIDLSNGWFLESTEEFAGSSHEKITMERYERK